MNSDHKPKTRSVSDLVFWFVGRLAYISVPPAELHDPWAVCSDRCTVACTQDHQKLGTSLDQGIQFEQLVWHKMRLGCVGSVTLFLMSYIIIYSHTRRRARVEPIQYTCVNWIIRSQVTLIITQK